jgi:AraC-like DNA-binding protein
MYVSIFWAINLLAIEKKTNKAKHFLGFFMLSALFLYLSHAIYFKNYHAIYVYFDPIYILASLSVYPLFYWYLKILTVEVDYNYKNLWHLSPAFLLFFLSVFNYIFMDNRIDYIQTNLFKLNRFTCQVSFFWNFQKLVFISSRLIFLVQIFIYIYLGMKHIRLYEKKISEFYSNNEGRKISWAKWLILIFSITALMSALANIIGRSYFNFHSNYLIAPALIFSTLIFLIGFLGSRQIHSIKDFKLDEAEGASFLKKGETPIGVELEEGLDSTVLATLRNQLKDLFDEQKIYLKPDLKISYVSQQLKTNRTYISKLINNDFNCSFSDFVNRFRVSEAKEIINNPDNSELTLEDIAEKSGFPTVASLIRIFKEFEGITPGYYKKKIQLSQEEEK